MTTRKPETRTAYTDGLRAVADWLDQHPEVPLPYLGAAIDGDIRSVLPIFLVDDATARDDLAAITRAMGTASKAVNRDGDRFQVYRRFEGLIVMAQAPREQVCTRVVTGTEDQVVEEVVTPAVIRKIVKTVDVVEWQCEPLLAAPAPAPAAHSFVRPGQVAADRPAPDACMECGQPEAGHPAPGGQCDVDWGSAAVSQRCVRNAGHEGQHTDLYGRWSPAELPPGPEPEIGIDGQVIRDEHAPCSRCGATDTPTVQHADGARCSNAERCAERVRLAEQAETTGGVL
jgi:hypothetical protein